MKRFLIALLIVVAATAALAQVSVEYKIGGHAGVTCEGPPTKNFQTYAGLVTRC